MKLYCTTSFGIEAVVKRELIALGYPILEGRDGGILTEGNERSIAELNVHLRSAERVWWLVDEFKATTFDELYNHISQISWSTILPKDASFPVSGKSVKSTLFSVSDCQAITKKAIVDAMQRFYDTCPETGVMYPIAIHLTRDIASVLIDTSGRGLHKRGYRLDQGEAPLKETLAAAMVQLSYYSKDRPLLDPFCGSGTIAIEAAMIAKNQAPGLYRDFVSDQWPGMKEHFDAVKQAALLAITPATKHIHASDKDANVIAVAIRNATRARVFDVIDFVIEDATTTIPEDNYPVIITNPPYGERLNTQKQANDIVKRWGEKIATTHTASVYVLTPHPSLETLLPRTIHKKRVLFNGPIKTTFYQSYGPKPEPTL
jgi:putative N6-adenine-specific DNA methylase